MKNISVKMVYCHQGHKLLPNMVYSVPDEVANGLVGLDLAEYALADACIVLEGLSWDGGTVLHKIVQPASIVQKQKVSQ